MLLVAPEDSVNTGNRAANSASISVPSFWLMYRGASRPKDLMASWMPWMVRAATSPRQALSAAAFSRSSRPIRPISWERVILRPWPTRLITAAASISWAGFTGENTPEMATARTP